MTPETYLALLVRAGKLKTAVRHCWLAPERQESVADHSWRMALMALLLEHEPEFAQVDLDRVIRLCLIHDLGEAFTGDIPTFQKDETDRQTEDQVYQKWLATFPEADRKDWQALLAEWDAQNTVEAKVAKALDKLEAVISHNESDITTWLPLEHDLQYTYPEKAVAFSPWLQALKNLVDKWTSKKESRVAGHESRACYCKVKG
ncbi:MAG: HD family hydrolase [Acidaminococcus sp.]|uniref:HD domain-containing protein n=1 Tax=Acidaminococcus sp. TaxID=1872103 RepID=UPI003F163FA5